MFPFFYILTNTCHFDSKLPKMLGQYLIVVLVCISLTIKDAEHLFLYLFVHLYIFFGQNVYSDPLSIFNYMMMMI